MLGPRGETERGVYYVRTGQDLMGANECADPHSALVRAKDSHQIQLWRQL